jgi:flagellar biogenesis protein FliO
MKVKRNKEIARRINYWVLFSISIIFFLTIIFGWMFIPANQDFLVIQDLIYMYSTMITIFSLVFFILFGEYIIRKIINVFNNRNNEYIEIKENKYLSNRIVKNILKGISIAFLLCTGIGYLVNPNLAMVIFDYALFYALISMIPIILFLGPIIRKFDRFFKDLNEFFK